MLILLSIVAIVYVYFFPTILAYIINHANPRLIFFTNLLLGWTVLGWFFILVWAIDRTKAG